MMERPVLRLLPRIQIIVIVIHSALPGPIISDVVSSYIFTGPPCHFEFMEPAEVHTPVIYFPETLNSGKRFHSTRDILDFLEGEAGERGLTECIDLYKVHNTKDRVWLRCKICTKHLNFKKIKNGESLVTLTVGREHRHTPELIEQAKNKSKKRDEQCRISREKWKKSIEESRKGTLLEELSIARQERSEKIKNGYRRNVKIKVKEEALKEEAFAEQVVPIQRAEVKLEPIIEEASVLEEAPVVEEAPILGERELARLAFLKAKRAARTKEHPPKKTAKSKRQPKEAMEEPHEVTAELSTKSADAARPPSSSAALVYSPPPASTSTTPEQFDDWLEGYCEQSKMRLLWDSKNRQAYPAALTVVTPGMSAAYQRYGDLLTITVLPDLVAPDTPDQKFVVALLTVQDSGGRPLLAGFSLYEQHVLSPLYKTMRWFFQMQASQPRTILTGDVGVVLKGLRELKQRLYEGSHIIHPLSVIDEATNHIPSKPADRHKLREQLLQAMTTRNFDTHDRIVRELSQGQFAALIKDLLHRKITAFYCQTGSDFVGLGRNSPKEVAELVREHFRRQLPIREFLMEMVEFETALIRKSNGFDAFRGSLELSDPMLEQVVQRCERCVVERFLENYLLALRECSVDESHTEAVVKMSQRNYTVKEGKCECGERDKTGIACPHLIAVTLNDGQLEEGYLQLIDERWQRTPAEK